MGFLSFVVLLGIAYLLWRVTDQLPDLIFRLSEIQRDIAEIRRRMSDDGGAQAEPTPPPAAASTPEPAAGIGSETEAS
jgi:hypothetical protein